MPGDINGYKFTRDGRYLYFSAGTCNYALIVYRTDIATKVTTRVSPPGDDCFETTDRTPFPSYDMGVAWTADGEWILAHRTRGSIELLRASDGLRLPVVRVNVVHPSFRAVPLP